jgi:holo-[acyl-carrier protein] synthase
MILGVGIDLVEVDRIQSSVERFGERFLRRILRPGEIAYCQSHRYAAPHIAARFAAKEAISKAFGTGIGRELSWLDMEVAHHPGGQPYVILHNGGEGLLHRQDGTQILLSLSHTKQYATAVAIWLTGDGEPL